MMRILHVIALLVPLVTCKHHVVKSNVTEAAEETDNGEKVYVGGHQLGNEQVEASMEQEQENDAPVDDPHVDQSNNEDEGDEPISEAQHQNQTGDEETGDEIVNLDHEGDALATNVQQDHVDIPDGEVSKDVEIENADAETANVENSEPSEINVGNVDGTEASESAHDGSSVEDSVDSFNDVRSPISAYRSNKTQNASEAKTPEAISNTTNLGIVDSKTTNQTITPAKTVPVTNLTAVDAKSETPVVHEDPEERPLSTENKLSSLNQNPTPSNTGNSTDVSKENAKHTNRQYIRKKLSASRKRHQLQSS